MTNNSDKVTSKIIYPFNKESIGLSKHSDNANFNFGLWFGKFIPLNMNDELHVCNEKGVKDKAVDFYKNTYVKYTSNKLLQKLLQNKHRLQYDAYKSYEKRYDIIVLTAELISRLITGIGQTHPNEVGMTFDHTLGIPYIPASSVKGIVRFSHTLELLNKKLINHPNDIKEDEIDKYFDDEAEWTNITAIFGKGGNKGDIGNVGNVVFLDAYPESIPKLSVDIMNPHYGAYYSEQKAPADYLPPTPIKFLTVEKGTRFIFRAMIKKSASNELKELTKTAIERALTVEGVGAKTAVGYGLFKINEYNEPNSIQKIIQNKEEDKKNEIKKTEQEKINNMPEIDKICYKLKEQYDEEEARNICKNIDSHAQEDQIKIAGALKDAWLKNDRWNKKKDNLSKKQIQKVAKIKKILGE